MRDIRPQIQERSKENDDNDFRAKYATAYNATKKTFLDRIPNEAFRELVSFELPSIVSVFLNTCFCSLFDSMYSYSYMYIIQDAYRTIGNCCRKIPPDTYMYVHFIHT